MERITEANTASYVRRFGAATLLTIAILQPNSGEVSEAAVTQPEHRASSAEWKLAWQDTFDGTTLGPRWEAKDNLSYPWDSFADYRQIGQQVLNGNLEIIVRGHCVLPGEDMTLANVQEAPCAVGEVRTHSTGRVEEAIPSITGDYRIDVVAKMPQVKDKKGKLKLMGTRFAVWTNNILKTPESVNQGYCDAISTTPTEENDFPESYGDGVIRMAHHVHCENGSMTQVSRVKKTKESLNKFHTYSVEHIKNRTRYLFDGVAVKLSKKYGKRSADKPSDFTGVDKSEFNAVKAYPHHMIFDSRVFTEASPSPIFNAPDPSEPFPTQRMKVSEVSVYTVDW